jgi:hypothetical protein
MRTYAHVPRTPSAAPFPRANAGATHLAHEPRRLSRTDGSRAVPTDSTASLVQAGVAPASLRRAHVGPLNCAPCQTVSDVDAHAHAHARAIRGICDRRRVGTRAMRCDAMRCGAVCRCRCRCRGGAGRRRPVRCTCETGAETAMVL